MIIYRKDKDKLKVKVVIEIDNVPEREDINKVISIALENIAEELWKGTIKARDGEKLGLY